MKRTTKRKTRAASAIITGDWHLREDAPICRTDNFQEAQWEKVEVVAKLQRKHQCPVLHAGDLFNHWKPSPALLSSALNTLPDAFKTIYGNHDLAQHLLDLAWKSGTHTLVAAHRISLLDEAHWGQVPEKGSLLFPGPTDRLVTVWHTMTWKGKEPWPGCTDPQAKTLLKKYPQFDLIVTGHNHKTFVEELDGRLLVNPGSLTRQTADQDDHQPCVFLWYAESNTVEQVFLPYEKGVISREHIELTEKRDARITAFVERLNTEWQKGVSFEENLERFQQVNQIPDSIMQIIRKAVDYETD